MDFRIYRVCAVVSLCAISFTAAAIGPFNEARDFVIAKSKEISLEQTGSAEFSMKYIAEATERAADICQQSEASRKIADRISKEACEVVAEKLDSQRKLLSQVHEEPQQINPKQSGEKKGSGTVMVLHAESDNKDYTFDIWPGETDKGPTSIMKVSGPAISKAKCYQAGKMQKKKINDLVLNVNKFKCDKGEVVTWGYSPENNVTTATINDADGRNIWNGFINTSTTYR